jgi:hypothetical protein
MLLFRIRDAVPYSFFLSKANASFNLQSEMVRSVCARSVASATLSFASRPLFYLGCTVGVTQCASLVKSKSELCDGVKENVTNHKFMKEMKESCQLIGDFLEYNIYKKKIKKNH